MFDVPVIEENERPMEARLNILVTEKTIHGNKINIEIPTVMRNGGKIYLEEYIYTQGLWEIEGKSNIQNIGNISTTIKTVVTSKIEDETEGRYNFKSFLDAVNY